MRTTIKSGIREEEIILVMSNQIEHLRKAIWRMIHTNKYDLSDCDMFMAFRIVNYELIHHSDERRSN